MSILTSVELVSQTKLHVSVYLFVSLYLCSTIDWIFFFRGFGYGPFRHCWGGHKHKKLTSVTNPREAGILGSYIPHFFENGLTFLSRIFCKTVPGVTTLQKITVWHSLLGVILGYFWAHFTVCSNISWEAFNIFSRNFIQMFLIYPNGYYTIFFFLCHVHLQPILVYVSLFLENRSIFAHEILYRCLQH